MTDAENEIINAATQQLAASALAVAVKTGADTGDIVIALSRVVVFQIAENVPPENTERLLDLCVQNMRLLLPIALSAVAEHAPPPKTPTVTEVGHG